MPPDSRVFGTVAVSTTRIHAVRLSDAKYSALAFTSSSVKAFAMAVMIAVFVLRVSALLRKSRLKSAICCVKYADGKPSRPAFSGRPRPFG